MKGYVDLYLLPVPQKRIAPYRRQAKTFGTVARQYGALNYREFIGDDLRPAGVVSFAKVIALGRGEVLTAAVAEFKSRRHRDQVMKKVLDDPRIRKMMQNKPLARMKQMHYGGFRTFVST
jgi:uncharacterized protein YbaA (DUF1428 family)